VQVSWGVPAYETGTPQHELTYSMKLWPA
jgi:hypothetical protein